MQSPTQCVLIAFTAAWIVLGFLGGSAQAQGPRLLDVELTLAQPQGAREAASAALPTLDDERPPRPLQPSTPSSVGYASGRWP